MTKSQLQERQAQAIAQTPGQLEEHAGMKFLLYTNAKGKPCVRAWSGNAARAFAWIYFDNPERRAIWIEERKHLADNAALARQARKLARAEYRHNIKPGAIMVSTWGYDQTNVDFYQVTATTEKTVTLRPIKGHLTGDAPGPMCGYVMPDRDQFHGEPLAPRRVSSGSSVSIGGYHASLWDGGKVYSSWYA